MCYPHRTILLTLAAVACLTAVALAQLETSPPAPGTLARTKGTNTPLARARGEQQEVQSNKTKRNAKDDAEMVFIPAGSFQMGNSQADYAAESAALTATYGKQIVSDALDKELSSELPQHRVQLSGYYIYKNVVTVGMYEKFCKETGRKMPATHENWEQKDHPMATVSWDDANAYCRWAGGKLPTEAQWEYAARGTDGRKYPWGNTFDIGKLWCSKSEIGDAKGTTAVGSYPAGASPFGVLDMAGNVCQWCSDYYYASFYSSRQATQRNPENTVANRDNLRVVRGGTWYDTQLIQGHPGPYADSNPDSGRVVYREGQTSNYRGSGVGFRCVLPAGSP